MLILRDGVIVGNTAPNTLATQGLKPWRDAESGACWWTLTSPLPDGLYPLAELDGLLRRRTAAELRNLPAQRTAQAAEYQCAAPDLLDSEYLSTLLHYTIEEEFTL